MASRMGPRRGGRNIGNLRRHQASRFPYLGSWFLTHKTESLMRYAFISHAFFSKKNVSFCHVGLGDHLYAHLPFGSQN